MIKLKSLQKREFLIIFVLTAGVVLISGWWILTTQGKNTLKKHQQFEDTKYCKENGDCVVKGYTSGCGGTEGCFNKNKIH